MIIPVDTGIESALKLGGPISTPMTSTAVSVVFNNHYKLVLPKER